MRPESKGTKGDGRHFWFDSPDTKPLIRCPTFDCTQGSLTMSERRPVENSEDRGEWVTPVVRRMDAGDAESGFPGAVEDAPYVLAS